MVLRIPGIHNPLFEHSEEFEQGVDSRGIRKGVESFIVANDGSGDFDEIQEAIDALPSEGGAIYIKRGTHKINKTIQLKDNITLRGGGYGTIIEIDTGTAGDMEAINLEEKNNIRIENMTLKVKGGGYTLDDRDHMIMLGDNKNFSVKNVKIETELNSQGDTSSALFSAWRLQKSDLTRIETTFKNVEIEKIAGDNFTETLLGGQELNDSTFKNCKCSINQWTDYLEHHNVRYINCKIDFGALEDGYFDSIWINCKTNESISFEMNGCKRNRIIGNYCLDIFLESNAENNIVMGNVTDQGITDNGTNNIKTGNVQY